MATTLVCVTVQVGSRFVEVAGRTPQCFAEQLRRDLSRLARGGRKAIVAIDTVDEVVPAKTQMGHCCEAVTISGEDDEAWLPGWRAREAGA